jgi:hypothetical protein
MSVLAPRMARQLLVTGVFLTLLTAPLLFAGAGSAQSSDLAPSLSDLVAADNPEDYAQANNLQYSNGSVLVVIEMRVNTTLSEDYQIQIDQAYSTDETRYVQGYAPVSQLTSLASEDSVKYVRPPTQGVADTNEQATTQSQTATQDADLDDVSHRITPRLNKTITGSLAGLEHCWF